ncbi:unnamed protein product [Cunninghamella echinulata]
MDLQRPLHQQVTISNLMFWYLSLTNPDIKRLKPKSLSSADDHYTEDISGKNKRANKSQSLPVPPRIDLPDNEYSTNTTQSVSSILINSQHRQGGGQASNNVSALAQLNPDYPVNNNNKKREDHDETQDTIQRQDPFKGKVEHPQQHKLLAQSDFWPPQADIAKNMEENNNTLTNANQLTVNSIN